MIAILILLVYHDTFRKTLHRIFEYERLVGPESSLVVRVEQIAMYFEQSSPYSLFGHKFS